MTTPHEASLGTPPESWLRRIPELAEVVALDVAGYVIEVQVTPEHLERVYLPVLAALSDLSHRQGRVLAGLAGIPGSGKSTFAAALAHVAGRVLPAGTLAVVGMDGWHHPNALLDGRTTCDAAGNVVPLRQRKGSPESFDAAALAAALRVLQSADHAVPLPVYDRRRHDPVPGALTIEPRARIIVVEGNYLLSDMPPWNEVSELLHPKLLLECEPGIARERVIARHVRGGLSREQATAKYRANDQFNTQRVVSTISKADLLISLTPPTGVTRLVAEN